MCSKNGEKFVYSIYLHYFCNKIPVDYDKQATITTREYRRHRR